RPGTDAAAAPPGRHRAHPGGGRRSAWTWGHPLSSCKCNQYTCICLQLQLHWTPMSAKTSSHTWALMLQAHAVLLEAMQARLKAADLPPLEWYDVLWALEQAAGHRLRMGALAERL